MGPAPSNVSREWPVIGQFSSIGSLGQTSEGWLTGEFLTSLSSTQAKGLAKLHTSTAQLQLVRVEL